MADISTTNLDSDLDSPRLARVDLLETVIRVNTLTRAFQFPSSSDVVLNGNFTVQGNFYNPNATITVVNSKSLNLENGSITSVAAVLATTVPNQTLDSFDAASYRTVKYTAQITWGSNQHAVEMMIVHDGLNARMTQYGVIYTGDILATFDVAIVNGQVQLLCTPVNPGTTFKLVRLGINA